VCLFDHDEASDTMSGQSKARPRGPLQVIIRGIGHVLTQIVVGLWVVGNSILSPLFRPLIRWLSGLRLIQAIERGIAALPAYAILVLLAAPFGAEEVVKIYSFVLMGSGHLKSGVLLYIACHVFAILVCERIFHAGKDKLMTIGWFARLFHWLMGYKDRLVDWFKSTSAYARMLAVKERARQYARRLLQRTRAAFQR
jgi:hypothetical protein